MKESGNENFFARKAQLDDAESIARLSDQLGYPSTYQEISNRIKDILGDESHGIYVAENAGGDILGWVHVFVVRAVVSESGALVGGLVVDKNHRSRGIGHVLVERAEEWARKNGCANLCVRSNLVRNEAHPFYERLGFKRMKTQHVYLKKL